MEKNIAIQVNNVSKTFRIPHEKITSLRGAFVNAFKSNKGYEEFEALDNVSFEVKKGEFFGIIGRNGSGKSTLLKILAGIYQPDEGKIKVKGRISPFLELGIGFQPELSGRDNIYLNSAVLGLTPKQIEEKFDDIVNFSELGRFIDQKVKNYSSGMHVRLAFSVAIHANREILLMDEVLAVGDTNFQSKCMTEFNRYKDMGKTVILVTHDIATVQRYCDRAMLLRNGKIEMIGSPMKVGDEYIYQNMSDEEKRIFEEEKRQKTKAEREAARIAQEQKIADQRRKIDERRQQTEEEKKQQEEKKRMEMEKVKLEEIKRNKVAEITGVEFLDKDGKAKSTFETGGALDIKISFKIHKNVGVLNFGVGMHSVFSGPIFGVNTKIDGYDITKHNNFIILHFDNLPILNGEYFVNVGCFGNVEQEVYDYKTRYKTFKMYSSGKKMSYGGIFDINHVWKI